ncbi:MAG: hypothetical protein FK734_10660 [Asgard group archaeon]|nr:hypothetical protein [Asgard group archaeon]
MTFTVRKRYSSEVGIPPPGKVNVFADPHDGFLKLKNPNGSITNIGTGGALGDKVWVVRATQTSSYYNNGVSYIPLVRNTEDSLDFQFSPGFSGILNFIVDYAMSVSDEGDIELRLDFLKLEEGSDPSAELTENPSFTITPGDDTNMHVLSGETEQSLVISASFGDHFIFRFNRVSGSNDTHPGDFRILDIRVANNV